MKPELIINTPKQREVFDCMMQGMNLKEAAEQAGLNVKYTRNMVARKGLHELVRQEKLKIAKKAAEELFLSEKQILSELINIGFSDVINVVDKNGNISDLASIPENSRRAISSIEVFEEFQGKGKKREFLGYTKKIKFWDKNKALESLCKHLGLFKKDNSQKQAQIPMVVVIGGSQEERKRIASSQPALHSAPESS